MDKSWMKKSRISPEYYEGVTDFLKFSSQKTTKDGMISCPCVKCVNSQLFTIPVVHDHLVSFGISKGYQTWIFHGESLQATTSAETSVSGVQEISNEYGNIRDILHDVFPMHNMSEPMEEGPSIQQPAQEPNKDAHRFYKLLEDAEQPLYKGCKNFSKLSAILHLYHLKCLSGWSNKSFTMLLQILQDLLPLDAKLPKDNYEAKKIIKDLGLGYEKIHACPNDCMLFWKENALDEACSVCGASRWKKSKGEESENEKGEDEESEDEVQDDTDALSKRKKKGAKILRWFPLKPRLQRLFMSSKTAAYMKWHAECRTEDGLMRHPADSQAWKMFNSQHVEFSSDPRNVRLGLSSDGFNPYGHMSTAHSTWPVILFPYNFPPWMCMKRSSFMLSLVIPGPFSPGNDIDVYLQPLIEELKELWDIGVETYDVSTKSIFQMHAALMWTINDFPAYGDLSGWNTKGALACPSCNYNTHSRWLKNGGKYCFMGHRRFLDNDHRFRKERASFDGSQEIRPAPSMLSGNDIIMQTEGVNCCFGKARKEVKTNKKGKKNKKVKRKRKRGDGEERSAWKKRSIFFTLPYWEDHMLRHNLDVMHIEKNVTDNIIGTLLNLNRKTKDNLKARLDLELMGIRRELHPQKTGSNKSYLPPACFTMTPREKDSFLRVLQDIRVPDGYASNISRCIQLNQRKIIGLKSHDNHILMQQLLPIAIRGSLPKNVCSALIDLSCFFREICSKVLNVEDLEHLEKKIAVTLCQLEKIFPPSFFTVMVHLVTHLATEAKIAGPVHYRWIYPIER